MNSSKHHREKTGPLIAITHPIDAYRVARCLLYYPAIGNRVASLGDIGREHTADVSVDAIVDYKVISIGPHESDYCRRLMAKHLSAPRANPASGYRDIHRLASTARSKLETEANGAEHNLRLLVGHANLLDDLMTLLYSWEQQQPKAVNEWSILLNDLGDESDEDSSEDESDGEVLEDEYDGESVATASFSATGLEWQRRRPRIDAGMQDPATSGSPPKPGGFDVAPMAREMANLASTVVVQVEEVMTEEAKAASALEVIENEALLHEYGAGEDLGLTRVASRMRLTARAA